ncbi:hypothetical protein [Dyella sp.]|uniref:hypothetical protein n=1 Tax=Dyella sp. TaxID=1869338 RepID=UPI002D767627|nr:hypothetical protein [Dyella sp.]HET6431276.1 hypothetical protein [Dyella sp.]
MHHGDFDDDERTVRSTFNRILASATTPADAKRGARAAASPDMPAAVTAEDDAAKPMFRRSASSPRDQWTQMDAKTGC